MAQDTTTTTQQEPEPIKLTAPQFIEVSDLSPASVGFNVIVKVGTIKPIMNRLNLDGTRLRISEAVVGDKTGSIILSLRNDQIALVKTGDGLILRNAKIDMVNNGYMRVAIDRWGVIEKVTAEQVDFDINTKENLSEVEYELIKEDNQSPRRNNRRN